MRSACGLSWPAGWLGLPLGLWLLPRLDVPLFLALLGGLLVVWRPVMLMAPRLPRIERGGRSAMRPPERPAA